MLIFGVFASDAMAKDMSRRFGVGVDSAMSSFADDGRGLSVVYNINKFFAMQLILGVSTYNADVVDHNDKSNEVSITEWNVSIRGIIPIVLSSDVNLGAIVGFTASGRASGGFKASAPEFAHYNDGYDFSIHTQVGIGITILTENGSALSAALSKSQGTAEYSTKASGAHVDFFKNVDLLGMAGFTFWF